MKQCVKRVKLPRNQQRFLNQFYYNKKIIRVLNEKFSYIKMFIEKQEISILLYYYLLILVNPTAL